MHRVRIVPSGRRRAVSTLPGDDSATGRPRLYKLFLTLRYLRKRRIAYFAIAAVTLCVMMVLIVMSIMGGWLEQLKFRARGLLGDVIVDNPSYSGFPLYQEFIDEIGQWRWISVDMLENAKTLPGVTEVHPDLAEITPAAHSAAEAILKRAQNGQSVDEDQVVAARTVMNRPDNIIDHELAAPLPGIVKIGPPIISVSVEGRAAIAELIRRAENGESVPAAQLAAARAVSAAEPVIHQATPVLYTWGLYQFAGTTINGTVRVVGIRLHDVFEVNAFKSTLFYNKFYPDTTTLEPQRQPVLGIDPVAPPVPVQENGDERYYLQPMLPSPYQEAWEKASAAGLRDEDSTETVLNRMLQRMGRPAMPGVYDGPLNSEDGPSMQGNELPGIIIGREYIAERQSDGRYRRLEYIPRGHKIIMTLWATSIRGDVDPIPIKQSFRYADDSRTGIYEIDSQHMYCDFALLQKLLQMNAAERVDPETGATIGTVPARCSQIQIKLAGNRPITQVQGLCRRMEAAYHEFVYSRRFNLDAEDASLVNGVHAMTWQESQAHIIGPVEKERILVTILFGIISLVAVTLVLCILYMIVLQKTRDIGIVKSIGGSSGGVAFIFVLYGAAVGVAGSLLGSVLGTLFVTNINEIQDFLIRLNPQWRMWDMQVYSFDRIPSEVAPEDIVIVVVTAIIASTFGSFVAAWRAGRMQPVEAVRYE